MKIKKKIVKILTYIFPSTTVELLVFFLALLAYGSFAAYIALHFRIVFDERIPWDAYFSFDNRAIVMTGGGFERHPLSNYFFDQIRNFALLFSNGKKDEVFRLVLALCSTFVVSLSFVQIFKYFRNCIGLPAGISLLILLFFAFFTTPILLSFTPETYTYTFFLLVLYNFVAASYLKNDQKIPGILLAVFGVSIGGLTITNLVKVYIPVFFEKNFLKSWKYFFGAVARVFVSVLVLGLLYLNRLHFDYQKIFSKTGAQYEKFSNPKGTPDWEMIYSWFFGGNMLFPSFVVRDYHNTKGFVFKALFMDVYTSYIPYVVVGLVFGLVFWSWLVNFKNKFAQILMLSFVVDIVIHVVLKFGLHTSYIYGGHFIFVVPMMLGWLFFHYKNNPNMQSFLGSILLVLCCYFATNNGYRLQEFFEFLRRYYV